MENSVILRQSPLKANQNFAISFKFSQELIPNHQDNSMLKSFTNKTYLIKKQKDLTESKQKLLRKIAWHRDLNSQVKNYKSDYSDYLKKLSKFEETEKIRSKAAALIQNFVRSYFNTKKEDQKIIKKLQKRLAENNKNLELHSRFCLYKVGKITVKGAIVIQRFVRRVFFFQKIKRIQHVYCLFKQIRQERASNTLRIGFQCYFSKLVIQNLKFLEARNLRLDIIRRKLAVIKIKLIVKRQKINLHLMKLKIRKYRRRNTFKSSNKTNKSGNTKAQKPKTDEQNTEENDSKTSENDLREKLICEEILRKEKVSLSLVSYQIKKEKIKFYRKIKKNCNSDLLTTFTQLELKPRINTPAPVLKKSLKNCSLVPQKPLKSLFPKFNKLNYLKQTVCSENNRFKEEISEMPIEIPYDFKYRARGMILLPTIASRKKATNKLSLSEIDEKQPKWKISTNSIAAYIPGIDNYSFKTEKTIKSKTPTPIILKTKLNLKTYSCEKRSERIASHTSLFDPGPQFNTFLTSFHKGFKSSLKINTEKIKGYLNKKESSDSSYQFITFS